MRFIIDRFEGDYAVVELENQETIDIPRKILPEEAKEGDIVKVFIDEEETKSRKEIIKNKFNDLFS